MPKHVDLPDYLPDSLIVGGGIIGLSIAYELLKSGRRVCIIDRQQLGREASWSGAGILPPGSWFSDEPWADEMARISRQRFPQMAAELWNATGIDIEYEVCGNTLFVDAETTPAIAARLARWQSQGIAVERLPPGSAGSVEPNVVLSPQQSEFSAWHIAAEAQVRNPRLLRALQTVVSRLGGTIIADREVVGLRIREGQCLGVETDQGPIVAGTVCVATGAWSSRLFGPTVPEVMTIPIRGQMLLLKEKAPSLRGLVHFHTSASAAEHGVYFVPRTDGHTLVGSTVDDVGFDKSTEAATVERFHQVASALTPGLASAKRVAEWGGLRPASHDGAPYIGPVPGVANLFAATGHFRAGLQFAPPTAALIRSMLNSEPPPFDPTPFRLDR